MRITKANSTSILIIFLIFVLQCTIACKKEFVPEVRTQSIQYLPFGLNSLFNITVAKSGDLYYSGLMGKETVLIKTSSNGSIIWKKKYTFSTNSYISNFIENFDGTFLFVGDIDVSFATSFGTDMKFIKLDANGNILKEYTYSCYQRDTITQYKAISTRNFGGWATDGSGGYYFTTYTNQYGIKLLHYNSLDSVDQKIDLVAPTKAYYGVFLVCNIASRKNGNVILEYCSGIDDLIHLDELDKSFIMQGKVKYVWRTSFPADVPLGKSAIVNYSMVTDDRFVYTFTPKINVALYSLDIEVNKVEMPAGTRNTWIIPLNYVVSDKNYNACLFSNSIIESDGIYCSVNLGTYGFPSTEWRVFRSATDGTNFWQSNIGGDISRDHITSCHLMGNEILINGFNTNNRNKPTQVFVCKLNKLTGKLILE